jgi:hypothetical protein
MDCKEFREILDLYIDDELSADASTSARIHRNECSLCRMAEGQLLQLRRGLKEVVAKHEPPPKLVEQVRRLSRSRWSRWIIGGASSGVQIDRPFWKTRIAIPAPAFALLMLAIGTFAILALRLYSGRENEPRSTTTLNEKQPSSPRDKGTADLSRFDHGGRASLYKTPQ